MTPRAQRFVGAIALVAVLLFIGRWSVAFVAERWWAATISPAAIAFVTNWQLLGFALDIGAVVIASVWFIVQALLVARAIASVQVTRRLGNLHLREAVPTRLLLGGATASGILLGWIAGAGAHAWRDPIVLAWHGVTYGVLDPLLNIDVGVYVGQLPAWDLLHRFAVLLSVVGLAFCFVLYSSIGALRRERGAIMLHVDARRHLGVLLAIVALVVAVGYRLAPYHLAASSLPTLTAAGAQSRVRAAEIMSGLAIATAILSLTWALKGRNMMLLASWAVLSAGALVDGYAMPALAEEAPPSPVRTATLRRFDALAWGIHEAPAIHETETAPPITALWDEPVLNRMVERGGGTLEAATPGDVRTLDAQTIPVWLLATPPPGDPSAMDIIAVADGVTNPSGAPILIRSPEEARSSRPLWRSLSDPRSRPSAGSWRSVTSGVNAKSPLRRLLLAWARQAPGMLGDQRHSDVDWHLDPLERAASLLPMMSWLPADIALLNARPVWIVQGMLTVPAFPLATRSQWKDGRVAGVAPAVICVVDAASGETHFYSDPSADSLAMAWSGIVGGLIGPASAIPAELRGRITYRAEWLQAQLSILQGPGWNAGKLPSPSSPAEPVWLTGRIPAHQVALEENGRASVATVVTAYRLGGIPQLRLDRRDAESSTGDSRAELRQLWNRAAVVMHLRDSVTAAGDTAWSRGPRWFDGAAPAAWQTLFAIPRNGPPVLLWVATSVGDRIGGGRTPAEAWHTVTEADPATDSQRPDDAGILAAARRALQRADSAFRRGDMTAFGRAFEELRRALRPARN